jgi:hypothetical protein
MMQRVVYIMLLKYAPDTKLSSNTKGRHWQWNAANLFRITVLIIQIRNASIGATLFPFIQRIFALFIILGLPS